MSVLWVYSPDIPPDAALLLQRVPATDVKIEVPAHPLAMAMFPQTVAGAVRGRRFRLIRFVTHGSAGRLQINGRMRSAYDLRDFLALFRGLAPTMPWGTVQFHGCGVASARLPPPRPDQASLTGQTEYRAGMVIDPINYAQAGAPDLSTPAPSAAEAVSGMAGAGAGGEASATMRLWLRQSLGYDFLRVAAGEIDAPVTGAVNYQEVDPAWAYEGPTLTVWPGRLQRPVLIDPANHFGWGTRVQF